MARPGKDYTGMKFGKLTVIEMSDKKDKHGSFLWHCKCDCGNDYYCIGAKLKYRRSCGCGTKPLVVEKYIGQQINDWLLLETTTKTDKGWNVRCQCMLCGNIKDEVNIHNIVSGRSKNCGCGRKQTLAKIRRKHTVESLQKQKFGRLTVKREYGRNKYGKILYECDCDCGAKGIIVLGNTLLLGHKKSCGCLLSEWNLKIRRIFEELGYKAILEKHVSIYTKDEGNKSFSFDVYVEELNLVVEYDGEGHFIPIDWGGEGNEIATKNLISTQKRDSFKNKYCEENGIHLLRIPYTEKDNMKELIINKIKTITENK